MKTKDSNGLLIDLAKTAIYDKLYSINRLDKNLSLSKLPILGDDAATFVTLTIDGNLRGCIGSLVPRQSLYDDIISNAKSAAFNDPRFIPLSKDEFENTKIEISILTPAVKVNYTDFKDLESKIVPNKDGVILKLGNHQATFLPQVWEQLPSFDLFMLHLYNKAGLEMTEQNLTPEIYTYRVKKIEE
ncbi:MAG: AmmeMemoRadiSam system protein A [Campylobacterota bacterium]|nr:AmmeMemoRadiSam system protein A [Campylobacterota bacterium]